MSTLIDSTCITNEIENLDRECKNDAIHNTSTRSKSRVQKVEQILLSIMYSYHYNNISIDTRNELVQDLYEIVKKYRLVPLTVFVQNIENYKQAFKQDLNADDSYAVGTQMYLLVRPELGKFGPMYLNYYDFNGQKITFDLSKEYAIFFKSITEAENFKNNFEADPRRQTKPFIFAYKMTKSFLDNITSQKKHLEKVTLKYGPCYIFKR